MEQIASVSTVHPPIIDSHSPYQSGYKTARVWAFGNTNNPTTETNVFYQTLNSSGQYFNFDPERGLPRLDYVIKKAEKLNIKLILTLLNNFDDLGGINTYTNIYGGSHNDFYTNQKAQDAYKKWIKFIVSRYRTSTAIFSWELCNEPRCSGCQTSVITQWATTISKYIKQLDPLHMVSLGDEGWIAPGWPGANGDTSYAYSGYEGVDFIENLKIKTLDYGTVHMYPNQWGYDYSWGLKWIQQHNDIGKAANKPVIIEEYSAPDPATRAQWLPQYQDLIVKGTSLASDMIWQFASRFPDGNNPFDGYAIYYDRDPNSEFQKFGAKQAKTMLAKPPVANL